IEPQDHTERVTLADLAPTTARLIGFDEFRGADGVTLPGIPSVTPPVQPRVVVTLVIDGGGWNVLRRWPAAWRNLEGLMRGGGGGRGGKHRPPLPARPHARRPLDRVDRGPGVGRRDRVPGVARRDARPGRAPRGGGSRRGGLGRGGSGEHN